MRRYERKADAEHPLDVQRSPVRVTAHAPPGKTPRSSTEHCCGSSAWWETGRSGA